MSLAAELNAFLELKAGVDVKEVFDVIFSTFAIMALGFLLPTAGVLKKDIGQGVGRLVGTLLLPSVLFKQMATLELGSIDPVVAAAMLLAKLFAFILTALGWWAFDSGADRLTDAGLCGLFTQNSNDLAVGLVIFPSIFPLDQYPQNYLNYLYVGVAINLVIVVPLGVFMLELGGASGVRKPWYQTLATVIMNPLVIAACSGLAFNGLSHLFGGLSLPEFIDRSLQTAGNAFPFCALFLVGSGLIGQLQGLQGAVVRKALFLVLGKLVLTPIVLAVTLDLLGRNDSASQAFGYIYGALPTAPSTVVVAMGAGRPVAVLSFALILTTLFWAPLTVVGAVGFSAGLEQLRLLLDAAANFGTTMSLVSLIFLFVGLYMQGPPERATLLLPLGLAQLLLSVSMAVCEGHVLAAAKVATVGRLSVACYSYFLILERTGLNQGTPPRGVWWRRLTAAAGLAVPIVVTLPSFLVEGHDVPAHLEPVQCFWQSELQVHLEFAFFGVIGVLLMVSQSYRCKCAQRSGDAQGEETQSMASLDTIAPTSTDPLAQSLAGESFASGTSAASEQSQATQATQATNGIDTHNLVFLAGFFLMLMTYVFVLGVDVDREGDGAPGMMVALLLNVMLVTSFGAFMAGSFSSSSGPMEAWTALSRRFGAIRSRALSLGTLSIASREGRQSRFSRFTTM